MTTQTLDSHKQVPVKVTAYVDEGIGPLVEVLNKFDGVQTTQSCQGDERQRAFVWMDYGDTEANDPDLPLVIEMAVFTHRLAQVIRESNIPDNHNINVSIHWWGAQSWPCITLELPQGHIGDLTRLLTQQQQFLNNKAGKQP